MTAATPADAPRGLVERMAHAWRAPRASTRAELATAKEARLLFYAFAASVLGVMATVGAAVVLPDPSVGDDFDAWAANEIAVGFFIGPLGLYIVAGAIGGLCRLRGGAGGWFETRVATFWTALVTAPAKVALTLLGAAGAAYGGLPAWAPEAGGLLGSALWAVLLAPALAEAHGFRSALSVFAAMAAAGALLAALAAAA